MRDPSKIKTQLCNNWINTGSCVYPNCTFAHGMHELKAAAPPPAELEAKRKTKMCKNHMRGVCCWGDRCIFAHSKDEIGKLNTHDNSANQQDEATDGEDDGTEVVDRPERPRKKRGRRSESGSRSRCSAPPAGDGNTGNCEWTEDVLPGPDHMTNVTNSSTQGGRRRKPDDDDQIVGESFLSSAAESEDEDMAWKKHRVEEEDHE